MICTAHLVCATARSALSEGWCVPESDAADVAVVVVVAPRCFLKCVCVVRDDHRLIIAHQTIIA